MFGTLMTLGGTFFYCKVTYSHTILDINIYCILACVYVYSDYIMSQQKPPPLPARICFYSGCYTSLISFVWIGFYTMPHFDELIQIKNGTSHEEVLGMYILVILANACHSWNYYELIDRTGSVSLYYFTFHFLLLKEIFNRWQLAFYKD